MWQRQNDAFVWTDLDGTPYRLLSFNQSATGVYIVYPDAHYSFHRDGNCHTRSAEHVSEPLPEMPYRIQPLAEVEMRLLGSHWFSVNRDSFRTYGEKILRPPATSRSLRIDRSDFGPLTQPFLDVFLYKTSRRDEVIDWVRRRTWHNPTTQWLDVREYPIDDHHKILGVFLHRLDYRIEEEHEPCSD